MTTKVYCVRYRFLSLVLLVSKPLIYCFINGAVGCVNCKCLSTGMTTKVYPIRQSLASLGKLASKPLKPLEKGYIFRNTALLKSDSDPQ